MTVQGYLAALVRQSLDAPALSPAERRAVAIPLLEAAEKAGLDMTVWHRLSEQIEAKCPAPVVTIVERTSWLVPVTIPVMAVSAEQARKEIGSLCAMLDAEQVLTPIVGDQLVANATDWHVGPVREGVVT